MNLVKLIKQFTLYLLVGGIATCVEWIAFFVFQGIIGIQYLIATALAFVFSTFANWFAGKLIMFKERGDFWSELAKVYLTSIAGLIFNLILMWLFVSRLGFGNMISKVFATGIVFVWNFLIRKLVIYKI
jgi:putative flippase GtrA